MIQTNPGTMLTAVVILVAYVFMSISSTAQDIWGMTRYGGEYDKGVIFKMDENASNQEVVFSFETIIKPEGGLTEYQNDVYYGMSVEGGKYDYGVIYKFEAAHGRFSKILDFDGDDKGRDGAGKMVYSSNGKMYGMTVNGGIHDKGILFEFNPANESFSALISFDGLNTGAEPLGSLIEGVDGKLYGVTSMGGGHDEGILFSYDIAQNKITKLTDFNNSENGSHPMGSLIYASDGLFYGMTRWGGDSNYGIIFSFNPVANNLDVEFEFQGGATGRHPQADLIEASNGKLYGMTPFGGASEYGVLFEYDPETNIFSSKVEFSGGFLTGSNSYGSLVEADNKMLYGLNDAELHLGDMLFEFNPATDDFRIASSPLSFPREFSMFGKSLTLGTNNKLYFIINATQNDIRNENNLYEYTPEDDEFTGHYKFSGIETGEFPTGSLCQGADGKLYGTTYVGGAYNEGVIFSIGADTYTYTKLIDFERESKGANPKGGLVQADNLKLYGIAGEGGTFDNGVIYELDPVTGEFQKLYDFDGINGKAPDGELVKAMNGKLYGTTSTGGVYDEGVLFELDPETGVYKKIIDFQSGLYGKQPFSYSLVAASNGSLYGTTMSGGDSDGGVLFEYNPETDSFLKVIDFDGSTGSVTGNFTEGSDKKLYGYSKDGKIASFDPMSQIYHIEMEDFYLFNPISGKLLHAANGKFYGMDEGLIWFRATDFFGGIHEFDVENDTYTQLMEFDWENGSNPQNGSLIQLKNLDAPVAKCKEITLYLDENGQAMLEPADIDNGSKGDGIQLSVNKTNFDCDDAGDQIVTLTVTDVNGVTSTCEATVTVIDNISPIVTCPDNPAFILEQYTSEYVIDGTLLDADATDNCSIESFSFTVNGGEESERTLLDGYVLHAGIYEVVWTATDRSGNVGICLSEIVIGKRATSLQILKNELDVNEQVMQLEVALIDEHLKNGIEGKVILFKGEGFSQSAVTNGEGVASLSIEMTEENVAEFIITVLFEEDETYVGSSTETGIITASDIPATVNIRAYPNPFTDRLNIEFVAPATTDARIDVYDPAGRLVKNIFNQPVEAGKFYKAEYYAQKVIGSYLLYRLEMGKKWHSDKVIYRK